MEAFLKEKIEERRKSPGQDLVTYLIQAAEGGDQLTEREALTLMKLCIIAGNDLTTQALALTLDCLLENPEQMRLLANDLSLASHAFEESLRYNGPVVFLQRKALRDVEIAGVKVPAGCVVAPLVSSANHDEAVFENPEVFDIRRTIPRVLSMSSGNHQCIGQPLARLEARVAFEEWFARVASFARKGPPQLTKQMGLRGFDQLPVTMERRPAKVAAPAPEDSVVKQAATAEKLAAHVRPAAGAGQAPDHERAGRSDLAGEHHDQSLRADPPDRGPPAEIHAGKPHRGPHAGRRQGLPKQLLAHQWRL